MDLRIQPNQRAAIATPGSFVNVYVDATVTAQVTAAIQDIWFGVENDGPAGNDLQPATLAYPFNGPFHRVGLSYAPHVGWPLSVGSQSHGEPAGWILARAAGAYGVVPGVPMTVAVLRLEVTALAGVTTLRVVPRLAGGGNIGALWVEDGLIRDTQAWAGQTVSVRVAEAGDANADGVVDGVDLGMVDAGFLAGGTRWREGDFNRDGAVDGADYLLMDSALARGGQLTARFLAEREARFGGEYVGRVVAGGVAGVQAVTLVPEGAGVMVWVVGVYWVGRRR